jgi:hypothetical protein
LTNGGDVKLASRFVGLTDQAIDREHNFLATHALATNDATDSDAATLIVFKRQRVRDLPVGDGTGSQGASDVGDDILLVAVYLALSVLHASTRRSLDAKSDAGGHCRVAGDFTGQCSSATPAAAELPSVTTELQALKPITAHNPSEPLICFNCIFYSKMKASVTSTMSQQTSATVATNILDEKNKFQLQQ